MFDVPVNPLQTGSQSFQHILSDWLYVHLQTCMVYSLLLIRSLCEVLFLLRFRYATILLAWVMFVISERQSYAFANLSIGLGCLSSPNFNCCIYKHDVHLSACVSLRSSTHAWTLVVYSWIIINKQTFIGSYSWMMSSLRWMNWNFVWFKKFQIQISEEDCSKKKARRPFWAE